MTDWSGDVYDAPCTYIAMLYVLGGLNGKERKARTKGETVFEPSRFYVTDRFFLSRGV